MDILIYDPEKTAKRPLLEEEMKSIISCYDALIRGVDSKASFVWAKKEDEKKIEKILDSWKKKEDEKKTEETTDSALYLKMDKGGNNTKGRTCFLIYLSCHKIEKILKAEKTEDTESKKELCTASAEKQ